MKKYLFISIIVFIIMLLIGLIFINYNSKREKQISEVDASTQEIKNDTIVENISNNIVDNSTSKMADTKGKTNTINKESITKENIQEQAKSTKTTTNKKSNSSTKIATANQKSNTTKTTNKSSSSSNTKQNTITESNNKTTMNNSKNDEKNSDTKVSSTKTHIHSAIGNCGKWFSSFDEFVAYFNSETKRWDELYDNGKVSWDNYIKNCPVGYQNVHSCQSHFNGNSDTDCGLITGDFVYQKK